MEVGICIYIYDNICAGVDMKKSIKKWILAAVLILLPFSVYGCEKEEEPKKKNIDFTVCDATRMPDELLSIIEEKKLKTFKLTYVNNNYLYIAVGYGEHDRRNLNVVVNDLYMTNNAIYVDTSLTTYEQTDSGASASDADELISGEASMCPYIVLKCEKYELPVIFDID